MVLMFCVFCVLPTWRNDNNNNTNHTPLHIHEYVSTHFHFLIVGDLYAAVCCHHYFFRNCL